MAITELAEVEQEIAEYLAEYLMKESIITLMSDIKYLQEINPDIGWRPSMQYEGSQNTKFIVEISEEIAAPYSSAKMAHSEILNSTELIAIYSISSEATYLNLKNQTDVKKFKQQGFGLYTFDLEGNITLRFNATPLLLHISKKHFDEILEKAPQGCKTILRNSYKIYQDDPPSGVKNISEIIEAIIKDLAEQASKKEYLDEKETKELIKATLAEKIKILMNCQKFSDVPALGGIQSFVSQYRNSSSHSPDDSTDIDNKYRKCKEGFLSAMDLICNLDKQMGKYRIKIKAKNMQ